jgi:hypothetical protein
VQAEYEWQAVDHHRPNQDADDREHDDREYEDVALERHSAVVGPFDLDLLPCKSVLELQLSDLTRGAQLSKGEKDAGDS